MKGYKLLDTAEDISVSLSKKAKGTSLNISRQINGVLSVLCPTLEGEIQHRKLSPGLNPVPHHASHYIT